MKKLLLIIPILLLSGCGRAHKNMTQEEMLQKQKDCEELGLDWEYSRHIDNLWERVNCKNKN